MILLLLSIGSPFRFDHPSKDVAVPALITTSTLDTAADPEGLFSVSNWMVVDIRSSLLSGRACLPMLFVHAS